MQLHYLSKSKQNMFYINKNCKNCKKKPAKKKLPMKLCVYLPSQSYTKNAMTKVFSHTAAILREAATYYDNFQNEVMILEFDDTSLDNLKHLLPLNPSRFDTLLFIGIKSGELEIQMDYVSHQVGKNSIIFIMPTHITYFTRVGANLSGWVLAISKSYITTLSFSKQQLPVVISYMQLKKEPLTVFDADEFQKLTESLAYVKNKIRKLSHLFYKETINVALKMFFLDLGDYYLCKKEHYITVSLTRKEELFIDFQNLLRENCMKRHDVRFYSGKLCITTQYLTSILKEQSGKSASQWIHEALVIEAKSMLKNPRITIQQVSDELNFPDQSTFCKFFKKNAGISPLVFRKS